MRTAWSWWVVGETSHTRDWDYITAHRAGDSWRVEVNHEFKGHQNNSFFPHKSREVHNRNIHFTKDIV